MKRFRCISCGTVIVKPALDDPYMCRDCEAEHGIEFGRYAWLDRAVY